MPTKITYFLGAGASANALPTVKGTSGIPSLSHSMSIMADSFLGVIDGRFKVDSLTIEKENLDFARNIANGLQNLANKSEEFVTVDTYAKFLFINEQHNELDELKKTLSIFFMIEQIINLKFDKRYIVFLTSIVGRGKQFPENVKIINWNYDFQLQIARKRFFSQSSSRILFGSYLSSVYNDLVKENFSLVNLNGLAGFYFLEGENNFSNFISLGNVSCQS